MTNPDRWAYDDLQLRIDRNTDGSYRTLAMAPDGRTARGVFVLPLTDDELDAFVQRVGLVRRRRGPTADRLGAIKELGASLFDALFADQVGNVYNAAKAAASDGERRLRITLHLSGAPELMRLPWEFLYHRPKFIAQSADTPIIRTLDVDSARRPQRLKLPLRILGITSSPVGYQQLDAESERRNLETALEPLSRDGLVELSWLNRATLRDLARRVSEPDEIHVIHYIGHGAYSEETEAGILVLETPEGRAHDVTGEEIGAMLQDERSLRLVVLNSCDGARTSHIDPFSGVATSLIEFDIPAVVGMQFEITDLAAVAFSESLYAGLAHGMPIDAAVGPARRAVMAMTTAEFGTPVLFLRDGDARLFEIDNPEYLVSAPQLLEPGTVTPVEGTAPPVELGPVEEPGVSAPSTSESEPVLELLSEPVVGVPTSVEPETVEEPVISPLPPVQPKPGMEPVPLAVEEPVVSATSREEPEPIEGGVVGIPSPVEPDAREEPVVGIPPSVEADEEPVAGIPSPVEADEEPVAGIPSPVEPDEEPVANVPLPLQAEHVVGVPSPAEPEAAVDPLVAERVEPKYIWEAGLGSLSSRPNSVQRAGAGRTKQRVGKVLWISAFSLSVLGLVGWSGFAQDVLWLEITWLTAFALAGVVGAVAAGVSAVRHRLVGILIALLSYPILFALAPAAQDGTWLPGLVSATQIALLWWARFTTKGRPVDELAKEEPPTATFPIDSPGAEMGPMGGSTPSAASARQRSSRAWNARVLLAVGAGWAGGALLLVTAWLTSSVWNGGELRLLGGTLILRILAIAVLTLHYFARRDRASWIASAGYGIAVVASIIVLATGVDNPDGRAIGEVFFGLVLVGIGIWLVIAGRRPTLPYRQSFRVPGPFVIAAGFMYAVMSVVWLSHAWSWYQSIAWMWSATILGMGASYAVSATILWKEAR